MASGFRRQFFSADNDSLDAENGAQKFILRQLDNRRLFKPLKKSVGGGLLTQSAAYGGFWPRLRDLIWILDICVLGGSVVSSWLFFSCPERRDDLNS